MKMYNNFTDFFNNEKPIGFTEIHHKGYIQLIVDKSVVSYTLYLDKSDLIEVLEMDSIIINEEVLKDKTKLILAKASNLFFITVEVFSKETQSYFFVIEKNDNSENLFSKLFIDLRIKQLTGL